MTLEQKIQDLGRLVLGGDVVLCLDAEHVLDAVMEKLSVTSTIVADDEEAATLAEIRDRIDDAASDLDSLRWRVEELARKREQKVA